MFLLACEGGVERSPLLESLSRFSMGKTRAPRRGRERVQENNELVFPLRQWHLSFVTFRVCSPPQSRKRRDWRRLSLYIYPSSATSEMRQRTLGFFLVPKEAEDRENDVDEGEEADEEVAVELSDDDESDSDGDDGESSDERGIETAAVLPLAPLEGNAAFQHHHHQQQQQPQLKHQHHTREGRSASATVDTPRRRRGRWISRKRYCESTGNSTWETTFHLRFRL